jgi:glutamine amidotransferase
MRGVTVVDYGRGNLFSLARALDHLGVPHVVSEAASAVEVASCIILPGVGAFGDAMQGLRERDLVAPLQQAARAGTPVLGICLGMEVLVSRGEEFGMHDGLDLIPGTVKRLPQGQDDPNEIRIPNVGWRALESDTDDPLLGQADAMYYFVHSFTPVLDDPAHIVATTPINGTDAAAIIRRNNIVGVQFHPEKSGAVGLALLQRFVAGAEIGAPAA